MKAKYSIRVKLFDWNPWSNPKFPYHADEIEELHEHAQLLKNIYDGVAIEDNETGELIHQ